MKPIDIAQHYFDAWNRRDPAAIIATFAEGGTYSDPTVPALTGSALATHTSGLFAAFPDLSFEIVNAAQAGDHAPTDGKHGSPARGRLHHHRWRQNSFCPGILRPEDLPGTARATGHCPAVCCRPDLFWHRGDHAGGQTYETWGLQPHLYPGAIRRGATAASVFHANPGRAGADARLYQFHSALR